MKKIEKLDISKMLQTKKWKRDKNAWKKINELIDTVNEIIENKSNNNINYELYSEINFKDIDWYVIEDNGNELKLLSKYVLDEEHIKKYCDDEFMHKGHDVRHTDTLRPIKWEQSYIKNVVLENFKKDLNIDCEITLLTRDEAINLPDEIRECNDWYWTRTPYDYDKHEYNELSGSSSFARVLYNGYSDSWGASGSIGVRPMLLINKSSLLVKDNKESIED